MDERDDAGQGQHFVQLFRRGVEFAEQLLADNERLRVRVAQLEQENRALSAQSLGEDGYRELVDRMRALERECDTRAAADDARDGDSMAEQHRELQAEADRLANLVVALDQLHSTLDPVQAVDICCQILLNLVGAGRFALYAVAGEQLQPVRAHGVELASLEPLRLGRGTVGRSAAERRVVLTDRPPAAVPAGEPVACVPLVAAGGLLGLFVVWAFLPQKQTINELDGELLRMLATHAGTAVCASALASRSDRALDEAVAVLRELDG
jgi:hypothetical protein